MGGSIIRHEPETITPLQKNERVYHIFQDEGWVTYLEKLKGFDADIALEFSSEFLEDLD
jgi:hypothetical protein